ncbi:MAG: restriction endonuclease subunit S [endosymbiont of Escarpia spicata]|uniref:Restriction endonuclease subunit S n=1 Tax=endosymbiont of Escarpia spicata TaxID=2200908 RepID=A0A370DCD4_9GAMM|nr:MAG: restriction endonuclease subunit S [endosymbiont of Escarpia spicata]
MKLTCDTSRAVPKFLYYFFKSHIGKYELLKNASQVGTPGIGQPLTSLKGIKLNLPPLGFQNLVADILTSLDDKIELNRQMNATLEAMAQALFKSWFVDFDPVIDNALAAGRSIPEPLHARAEVRAALGDKRKPLPEAIQKQFPSRFVFSDEMGWVPEGWGVNAIGDVLELAYGKSLPATKRIDGNVPVYGSGGVSGYHNEKHAIGPGVVVGRKGTVGSLHWVEEDYFPIDTVFYVVEKIDIPLFWIYQALQRLDIKSMGADSAVPGVNRNAIYARCFILPPNDLFNTYLLQIEAINTKRRSLELQNVSFSCLRDTLLPKLLSGQLRIPDAEAAVGAASSVS